MNTSTDLFAYLAAFVTIVLAIAVTDMVHSTHRLLRQGRRVRWHVIPILAAVFVFLSVLSEFFELWRVAGTRRFGYFDLVGLMVTPMLVAIAACAVLPDEVPQDGLDLQAFYFANRRYLFSIVGIALVGNLLGSIRLVWLATGGAIPLSHPVWWLNAPVTAATLLICIVLAWSARRWVHYGGLIVLLIASLMGYSMFSIQSPSPPGPPHPPAQAR